MLFVKYVISWCFTNYVYSHTVIKGSTVFASSEILLGLKFIQVEKRKLHYCLDLMVIIQISEAIITWLKGPLINNCSLKLVSSTKFASDGKFLPVLRKCHFRRKWGYVWHFAIFVSKFLTGKRNFFYSKIII